MVFLSARKNKGLFEIFSLTPSLSSSFQYYCTTTKTLTLAQPRPRPRPRPRADQHHRDPREGRAVPDLHPPAQVDAGRQPDQQRAQQHAERPDDLRPTDNAFSSLPSGTLNSLTDQQKDSLIQYHILPTSSRPRSFQTVSNPLRTQAGDSSDGQSCCRWACSGRPSAAPSPSEQQKKKKSSSAAEGPASTTPADSTSGSLAVGAGRDNHILVFAVVSVLRFGGVFE
uniref:FAS1 domain-containing protein n=1 Tax=Ananas comosus var. bracteatus TaxID=296719 RepID=A0A6V7Q9V0_ANACO|nr:unnamed protein product [Ananas comosus var. bracteatus]